MSPRHSAQSDDIRLPTLRDLVGPLFRYRRSVVLTFLAVMAITGVAASFATRTYESRMKIFVKRERFDTMVTSEAHAPAENRGEISENEMYSEVELLLSRDLLERVATATGLVATEDPSGKTTEAVRLDRAVSALRDSLSIEPVRKTTVIAVSYRSHDPQLAANVLNQLATLYLAKHLAVHRPSGARQFFTDQAERYQADLREAEGKLNAFGTREHVVSAAGERESTMQKLAEFEASLQLSNAAVADATRRMTAVDEELAETPARHVTQIRDGGNIEVIRALKNQILQLELKHTDLVQKFNPQYPPLVEVETELGQLRTALAEAERAPLRDETTDRNPTYQWLGGERARVRTERDALLGRAEAIKRSVQEYRDRAGRLDAQSVEQQALIRDVKSAEENLLLYQHKEEEARISDELDRTRIANVALAESPSVPQTGQSQRRALLLGGTIVALLLSLVVAYLRQAMHPYFRTPDDVYQFLDVPVLASLPAGIE